MNAIDCRGLTKTYPGFTLDHLTFTLPSGCILGLVGENGAGKSTAISLLMNAIHRDEGEVAILGTDNRSPDFLETRQDVGVVLDEACFPEMLTAREMGSVFSRLYRNWDPACYEGWLDRFGLDRDKKFKDLSRGTRMKLALAAALSHDAKLLLLDEATSGLDPMVRDEILDVLNDFTRDESRSVVLSSHIVSDLEKVCDYIAFLHQGKLVLFEEKDRLLEEYALVKLPADQLEALDPAAVAGKRVGPYGAEVLAKRDLLPAGFVAERTTLEDIILFLAKKEGD